MPQMKPTVQDEDMEDDLAAEEENKLINEVSQPPPKNFTLTKNKPFSGVQNMVHDIALSWWILFQTVIPRQEKECTIPV